MISVRAAVQADHNFIVRGWASEMRRSAFSQHVPNEQYWPAQHELIERLLSTSAAVVAHDPEDAAHLYGCLVWLPGELSIVHWVYVRGSHRRLGIARQLLEAMPRPIYCTQASGIFNDRDLVKRYGLVYSPYLLLGIAPQPSGAKDTCQIPARQSA